MGAENKYSESSGGISTSPKYLREEEKERMKEEKRKRGQFEHNQRLSKS
jgi:hypothetical protein